MSTVAQPTALKVSTQRDANGGGRQPADVLRAEMRAYRQHGARLAAMILIAEPSLISDMAIGDFLRQIPYVDDEKHVGRWLARAGVNPLRRGSKLSHAQRRLIAGQLARYARGDATS